MKSQWYLAAKLSAFEAWEKWKMQRWTRLVADLNKKIKRNQSPPSSGRARKKFPAQVELSKATFSFSQRVRVTRLDKRTALRFLDCFLLIIIEAWVKLPIWSCEAFVCLAAQLYNFFFSASWDGKRRAKKAASKTIFYDFIFRFILLFTFPRTWETFDTAGRNTPCEGWSSFESTPAFVFNWLSGNRHSVRYLINF